MNQTDTPLTDGFYGREFAEGRTGWTHAQYEHAAQLEHDRAALIAALQAISAMSSIGPLAAADMQNVANATLNKVQS